ncbi:hypothetical protein ACE6H2_025983 [Prunus campanulata]
MPIAFYLTPSFSKPILPNLELLSQKSKNMNMKKLPFLLLAILTLRCLKPISAACHVDDEEGLLAFKSGITADPSNKLSSWKPGTDCCAWAGINCLNNRVTSLSLGGQPDQPNIFLSVPVYHPFHQILDCKNPSFSPFPKITVLFSLPHSHENSPSIEIGKSIYQLCYLEE